MLNVYAKKGQRIQPKDLMRFPWEEKEKEIDNSIMAMAEKRWAKWDEDIKNAHGSVVRTDRG